MLKEKGKKSPITLEQEKKIMQEVSEFYKKASNGKFNPSFEVMDWLEVNNELNDKNPVEFGKLADTQLSQLQTEGKISQQFLDNFQTRLYVLDQTGKRPISGHGAKHSPYSMAWVYESESTGGVDATKHELGHAFGLVHVDTLVLKNQSDYTNIAFIDAGTGATMMGRGYSSDLDGVQKFRVGWTAKDSIESVNRDCEVGLISNQDYSPGKKLLRVQKPDTNEFYYIEYDTFDKNKPVLRFYLWDEKTGPIKNFLGMGGPVPKDGDEFYDKINRIRVRQSSHSDNDVRLSVQFNN